MLVSQALAQRVRYDRDLWCALWPVNLVIGYVMFRAIRVWGRCDSEGVMNQIFTHQYYVEWVSSGCCFPGVYR
jgi:hypothetical protein